MKETPLFAYCGVDFAGPLYIRVAEEPFTARRGIPLKNNDVKTFISAAQTMEDMLTSSEVQQYHLPESEVESHNGESTMASTSV